MITAGAKFSIQPIPLSRILVCESKARYPSMVMLYVQQMQDYPHDDPGLLRVKPSSTHPGLFELIDGYHRFVAAIIVGRSSVLCVVIEEAKA